MTATNALPQIASQECWPVIPDRVEDLGIPRSVINDLILRYLHFVLTQVSQSAVCNRFHTLEERLSRWLMISREFIDSDEIPLTQELLSQMLGVARTGVTMTAGNLQQSGLIRYRRGHITILDRQALADASCECYRIVKQEFDRYLKS